MDMISVNKGEDRQEQSEALPDELLIDILK